MQKENKREHHDIRQLNGHMTTVLSVTPPHLSHFRRTREGGGGGGGARGMYCYAPVQQVWPCGIHTGIGHVPANRETTHTENETNKQKVANLGVAVFDQLHSQHQALAAHITNDAVLLLQCTQPFLYVASNLRQRQFERGMSFDGRGSSSDTNCKNSAPPQNMQL